MKRSGFGMQWFKRAQRGLPLALCVAVCVAIAACAPARAQGAPGAPPVNASPAAATQPGPSVRPTAETKPAEAPRPGPTVLIPPPPAPAAQPASPLSATSPLSPAYQLGGGDRVRLIVFGERDLSGEYVVDSIGQIAVPLIGEVRVIGLTIRQAEAAVAKILRDGGYLNDPRVSIEVLNFRPFYILGEVMKPSEYPYVSGLTVFNAVATAGGFTPLADQTRVFIKRAGVDREEEVRLSATVAVQPGDTVRIAKGAFYILGEVNAPDEYPFSEGLTVQNAVAIARGFTYRANRGVVFIKRAGELTEKKQRLTPSLTINPGDTIRIPERFF